MASARRIRPARHYQSPDNATRKIAEAGKRRVSRDLLEALSHLGDIVPAEKITQLIKDGRLRDIPDAIPFDHFREVLKKTFARIAKVYQLGAQLGVRKINGSFAAAGKRVRYRKFNPYHVQSGPEGGEFTSGDGSGGGQRVYHGTTAQFESLRPISSRRTIIDRSLGIHVAQDPEISNTFAMKEGGRIIPMWLEGKYLTVDQPRYESGAIATDQRQIEIMAMGVAYRKDPSMLARYLTDARAVPADKVASIARDLVAGKEVAIPGDSKPQTLDKFLNNYGGSPYNEKDRANAISLARSEWEAEGYQGLKYINTAPMETENAKDLTSYVVFDPAKSLKPAYVNKADRVLVYVVVKDRLTKAYNPDEPRDYHGRWEGGSGQTSQDITDERGRAGNGPISLTVQNNPSTGSKRPFEVWGRYASGQARNLGSYKTVEAALRSAAATAKLFPGLKRIEKAYDPNEARDYHGRWTEGGDLQHGTTSAALKRIASEGLIPQGGHGADAWLGHSLMGNNIEDYLANSRGHVFLTTDEITAQNFALYAVSEAKGDPVVLEVHIPDNRQSDLALDAKTLSVAGQPVSYMFKGSIPPEWIKGVATWREGKKTVQPLSMFKAASDHIVVYAIVDLRDYVKKFDPSEARDYHGRWIQGGGSETIAAYHGTKKEVLDSILKDGIVTGKPHNFDSALYRDTRGRSVFITEDELNAQFYAQSAADKPFADSPGSKSGTPIILELKVPLAEWNKFKTDAEDPAGRTSEKTIPPSWIVKATEVDRYVEGRGGNRTVLYQKGYVTAYAVIIVQEPDEARDAPGQSRLHTDYDRAKSDGAGAIIGKELDDRRETDADPYSGNDWTAQLLEQYLVPSEVRAEDAGVLKAADTFTFDMFDSLTLNNLREGQDLLIQDLEIDARDSIASIINAGVERGISAEEMVDDIRGMIGLTDTQTAAVMNYRNMLQNNEIDALTRALRNTEMDGVFGDAVASGESLGARTIIGMVADYVSNYLTYRARTIAQTESVRAASEGLHDAYLQAVERGALPADAITREWELGDTPCPICESIPDLNPDGVGLEANFKSIDGEYADPPVHPNCMCSVNYITDIMKIPADDEDVAKAFDPNEARDEHGRWTASGAEIRDKIIAHLERTGMAPNYNSVGGYEKAKPVFDAMFADGTLVVETKVSPKGRNMRVVRLAKYDPNEARNRIGEWTAGGEPEKVKSAAIKVDGRVFEGSVHSVAIDRAAQKLGVDTDALFDRVVDEELAGFTTTTGRFVSRKEAMKIAIANDQLTHDIPDYEIAGGQLDRMYLNKVLLSRALLIPLQKYSPDEPRDYHGRWTAYGGGPPPPVDKPVTLVFGGSFNPPHEGHVSAVTQAQEYLRNQGYKIQQTIVTPSPQSLMDAKLGARAYPLAERVELGRRQFAGTDAEVTGAPARAADNTQGKLRRTQAADFIGARYPGTSVVTATGNHDSPGLNRPASSKDYMLYSGGADTKHAGYYYLSIPRPEGGVSSTKIRAAIKAGTPIPGMKPETVSYLNALLTRYPEIAKDWHFDPDQPRDYHGRWTKSGSSATDLFEHSMSQGLKTEEELIGRDTGTAKYVEEARRRLANSTPTDALVSQGGFKNPDGTWTEARQKLHQDILGRIFSAEAVKNAMPRAGETPTMAMLGGRGGSGKSWVTQEGPLKGRNALLLDSDHIKGMLPEYRGWNAANVHEEASHILDLADKIATGMRINVINDATMKSMRSTEARALRYAQAGYDIEGYYVYAAPDVAAGRALGRFVGQTEALQGSGNTDYMGRFVSPSYILGSLTNEKSFDAMKSGFSKWAIYDSNVAHETPALIASGGKK